MLATWPRPAAGWRPGALLALGDVELDGLAFQRTVALDGADVHEHVVAVLGLDEAVALVGVEPLDGPNRHAACPPSGTLEASTTPPPRGRGGRPTGCGRPSSTNGPDR